MSHVTYVYPQSRAYARPSYPSAQQQQLVGQQLVQQQLVQQPAPMYGGARTAGQASGVRAASMRRMRAVLGMPSAVGPEAPPRPAPAVPGLSGAFAATLTTVVAGRPNPALVIGGGPDPNGVTTVMKQRDFGGMPVTVHGLPSRSPLINAGLFSFDPPAADGRAVCLGETVILEHEIETFRRTLESQDFHGNVHVSPVHTSALHTHWIHTVPTLYYTHWEAVDDPLHFAQATAAAWEAAQMQ